MLTKPKKKKMSRRQFTRLMLAGTIGAGVAVTQFVTTQPFGLVKWFDFFFRRAGKSLGAKSEVAIVNAPSYDVDLLTPLRSGWELLSKMPDLNGKRIVIKPNIFYNIPGHTINTNAAVIDAAIQLFQEKGAKEIIVAEGTAYQRDITDLLYSSEIGTMLQMRGIKFVDLNQDDIVKVPTKGGYTTRENTWLPKTIVEADLIVSMPKMKTHHWAGATLSMKNLYGIVPGVRYGWPKNTLHVVGIETSISELYETIAPQIAIVDGIIGMEEDGPLFGLDKPTNVMVIGTDLVAVDATCARIMGLNLSDKTPPVAYINNAQWLGQGLMDADRINVLGASIESVAQKYKLPPTFDKDSGFTRTRY